MPGKTGLGVAVLVGAGLFISARCARPTDVLIAVGLGLLVGVGVGVAVGSGKVRKVATHFPIDHIAPLFPSV